MLKNKRILLIIILAVALFLMPSVCNAVDATETTKTSTGSTVKWSYDLEGESIVNLKCTNVSEISGELTIPSTIDGKTVKSLGDVKNKNEYTSKGAFEGCTAITSVTIPNTVTNIGLEAFRGCAGLRTINIPDTVVNIGEYAFEGCKITSINLPPNLTNIGKSTFYGCIALKEITIPANVTIIGEQAFQGCVALRKITIPNNVTTINTSAFRGCVALEQITIPDNVTAIGSYAFEGCSALKNVLLSNNLTEIKHYTFSGCTSLTSIVIPDSVSIIRSYASWGGGAFEGCTNLAKILIPDNVATIEAGVFEDCSKLTIYGNDNQESKRYAEDNNIHFDYIANWNKKPASGDITPPVLESLMIDYSSAFKKDEGTNYYLVSAGINIAIKATFEEVIYGETAPKLTIKCGNGSNIELNNGSIQGKYIIYTYTIKDQDKGIISAVSMTGGDITDEAGNKVEKYTCPELVTSYIVGKNFVYANGKGSATTDEENNQNPSTTATLSSIAITKAPTKVNYTEGEKFDKSGMVVTATYSDGTTKQITNYSVSPSVELKTGDTQITITYTENGVTKTTKQTISVAKKETKVTLSAIAITKTPTRNTYLEGEKFDKSGMIITATYSDKSTKQITNYTVSPSAELKVTDTQVIITYTENGVTKTIGQKITVTPKASQTITLSSIKITKAPTKTKYTEGEKFNKSGMIVTATYSNGTTKQITNYTVSPSVALKTTNKKVTVTYTENGVTKTVEQTISVAKDTTTKGDNKLPQTGASLLILAVISFIIVAVISKIKYGKFKDI